MKSVKRAKYIYAFLGLIPWPILAKLRVINESEDVRKRQSLESLL